MKEIVQKIANPTAAAPQPTADPNAAAANVDNVDPKKVNDIRYAIDNGGIDNDKSLGDEAKQQIIKIHKDGSIQDDEKHKQIAAILAQQHRNDMNTSRESRNKLPGDNEFFESIFKHYRSKPKSWY